MVWSVYQAAREQKKKKNEDSALHFYPRTTSAREGGGLADRQIALISRRGKERAVPVKLSLCVCVCVQLLAFCLLHNMMHTSLLDKYKIYRTLPFAGLL